MVRRHRFSLLECSTALEVLADRRDRGLPAVSAVSAVSVGIGDAFPLVNLESVNGGWELGAGCGQVQV